MELAGNRVVITGMGTINPLGNSLQETWEHIQAGKSGITRLTKFPIDEYKSQVAGEVKNFNPGDFMDRKESRNMADFTKYAVAAAVQAVKQAEIKLDPAEGFDQHRAGVYLGNGIGGFEITEGSLEKLFSRGPNAIAPMTIPKMISNEAAANMAIKFGFKGPSVTVATACASGTDAVGAAYHAVKYGIVDTALAGGTEGAISKLAMAGFCRIQALSTQYNDEPEKASRPFDKDRDGFIMGEGAGVLLLETLEHAQKRGANILAEIAGYGITCDAGHITAPDPEGDGAARAMSLALENAGMQPEDIDYINAHGTSTPTNDPIETKAIKKAFGDHAYKLKASSTKSMTAHLIGAAGGVEAIISVLAIQNQFFPPTINLDNPDDGCDLDYVPKVGVPGRIRAVLTDSLGFGGHNGALIIREFSE